MHSSSKHGTKNLIWRIFFLYMHVVHVGCSVYPVQNILSRHCSLWVLCALVDEGCLIMVSHDFSAAGGYACLTVMQTTVGEPRTCCSGLSCLLCMPYNKSDFVSFFYFPLERITLSGRVCTYRISLHSVHMQFFYSTSRTKIHVLHCWRVLKDRSEARTGTWQTCYLTAPIAHPTHLHEKGDSVIKVNLSILILKLCEASNVCHLLTSVVHGEHSV